jgi:proteasome lid subunit RPN8/RPN11
MRFLLALALLAPSVLPAQDVRVSLVALAPDVASSLRVAYGAVPDREQAWCVRRFFIEPRVDYDLITVLAVAVPDSIETTRSHTEGDGYLCRDAKLMPQPMIHSHPGGSCQASPSDVRTIVMRMARFDAILCGATSLAVFYARDYQAVMIESVRASLASASP